MTDKPTFVYVSYIESPPEKVWQALTDPDLTAMYWDHRNVSDWQVGSSWEHQRTDGTGTSDGGGTVVESSPPNRLVFSWGEPGNDQAEGASQVVFEIERYGEIVRLTVTHENLADEAERNEAAGGWAAVLANLKTFLETGHALSQKPWEVPARR